MSEKSVHLTLLDPGQKFSPRSGGGERKMPPASRGLTRLNLDEFQKLKNRLVAECCGFPKISGTRPETPGDARNDARKIGNFSDEFSGTLGGFSGGLGLNPDSCDIQLYTTF